MGPVTTAVLDDTCGNLIQIAHQVACRAYFKVLSVGAGPGDQWCVVDAR